MCEGEEIGIRQNVNLPYWLWQRALGTPSAVGTGDSISHMLYKSVDVQGYWDPQKTDYHHYGSIFNFDFSTDGSVLVAACEGKSFLVFDPNNHRLVEARDNAHSDCVNCVRFLDTRTFATCSDDTTVALWDLRFLKNSVRVFVGHTNWVKNIEYASSSGLLITSGFDGKVNTWNINNYSLDESQKQVFHSLDLMRCRLTPDDSKLVISTSKGHLLIIHDLDFETLDLDMETFTRGRLGCTMSSFNRLLQRPKNRLEIVNDFPDDDAAEIIASLQVHPQGWCIASRNTNVDDISEWTCIHDIQDQTINALAEDESVKQDGERTSLKLYEEGTSARTRSARQVPSQPVQSNTGSETWSLQPNLSQSVHIVRSNLDVRPYHHHSLPPLTRVQNIPVERILQTRAPFRLMAFLMNDEEEMVSSDEDAEDFDVVETVDLPPDGGNENQEALSAPLVGTLRESYMRLGGSSTVPEDVPQQNLQTSSRSVVRPDSPIEGLYPSGADPYSYFLWSRLTRPSSPFRQMANFMLMSRDLGRAVRRTHRSGRFNPLSVREVIYNCENPSYKSNPRLLYFAKENNSGRGFIKESCFSSDGRILISPFDNGVRLLSFDSHCRELCDCEPTVPEQPRMLHTLKQIMSHTKVVLTTRFSPTHNMFVTGGMDGSVAFLTP